MKFTELKENHLKYHLIRMDLPTSGNKTELQQRLSNEFSKLGVDISTYKFPDILDICMCGAKINIKPNSMFAALMVKMEDISKEVKVNNETILTQINTKLSIISDDLKNSVRATNEKIMETLVAVNRKYDTIAEQLSNLTREGDSKIDYVDQKLHSIEAKIRSMQNPKEITEKIKAPCFDGSTPINIFKIQFEAVANKNGWNMGDKCTELILALKGAAAEVLETVSLSSYEDIMAALQCKFGDKQKRVKNLELRIQEANESLQEFALEIERLGQLAYPEENHSVSDNFKRAAFVNGIRDPEVKSAVCASTGLTFAESVSFALDQEKPKPDAKSITEGTAKEQSETTANIESEITIKKNMNEEGTEVLRFNIDFAKLYTGESVNELLKQIKQFAQLDDTVIKIETTPISANYTVNSPVRPTPEQSSTSKQNQSNRTILQYLNLIERGDFFQHETLADTIVWVDLGLLQQTRESVLKFYSNKTLPKTYREFVVAVAGMKEETRNILRRLDSRYNIHRHKLVN